MMLECERDINLVEVTKASWCVTTSMDCRRQKIQMAKILGSVLASESDQTRTFPCCSLQWGSSTRIRGR